MHVGVKFCGGCNPRYDRRAFYLRMAASWPQHTFSLADEETVYDCLLVIGGCPSCCASHDQYHYARLIKVWDPADPPNLT